MQGSASRLCLQRQGADAGFSEPQVEQVYLQRKSKGVKGGQGWISGRVLVRTLYLTVNNAHGGFPRDGCAQRPSPSPSASISACMASATGSLASRRCSSASVTARVDGAMMHLATIGKDCFVSLDTLTWQRTKFLASWWVVLWLLLNSRQWLPKPEGIGEGQSGREEVGLGRAQGFGLNE